jgi:hypothetical protein
MTGHPFLKPVTLIPDSHFPDTGLNSCATLIDAFPFRLSRIEMAMNQAQDIRPGIFQETAVKGLTVISLCGLLASCQLSFKTEPSSVKELLPLGSTLTLNRNIEIPADRSSVYIFRGKVVPYELVDIYYPYCKLRLYKISSQSRPVKPDNFTVTKIVEWEDYTRRKDGAYKVAYLTAAGMKGGVGIGIGVTDDGGPSIIHYATILSLRSSSQPKVKEMVCGHWGDRGDIEALTLKELESALGELFTVNVMRTSN